MNESEAATENHNKLDVPQEEITEWLIDKNIRAKKVKTLANSRDNMHWILMTQGRQRSILFKIKQGKQELTQQRPSTSRKTSFKMTTQIKTPSE